MKLIGAFAIILAGLLIHSAGVSYGAEPTSTGSAIAAQSNETPNGAEAKPAGTSQPQSESSLGVWDGFRNIKWGADVKKVTELVVYKDWGGGYVVYTRKNEELRLGQVRLEAVWYGFFKGRFVWAAMITPAADSASGRTDAEMFKENIVMHDILVARFGKGVEKRLNSRSGVINTVDTKKDEGGKRGYYEAAPAGELPPVSEWSNDDVLVQFVPSASWGLPKKFTGNYVEMTYLPLAREKAAADDKVAKGAEAARAAAIEAAANTVQPSGSTWEGFKGIKWGADIMTVTDLMLVKDFGDGLALYTRKSDAMFLGEVSLKGVYYSFYKGRFCQGTLISTKPDDGEKITRMAGQMHEILLKCFGQATDPFAYSRGAVVPWLHGDISVAYYPGLGPWVPGNIYPLHCWVSVTYLPMANDKASADEAAKKSAEAAKKAELEKATKKDF